MNRILVIDDEEMIGKVIKDLLESTGNYRVIVETDGKSGLKRAQREIPDLILLDIEMPKLNGLEVLKKLRHKDKTRFIPVIMITGHDSPEMISKASYEYAEHYLVKPIDYKTLISAIARVLSARESSD